MNKSYSLTLAGLFLYEKMCAAWYLIIACLTFAAFKLNVNVLGAVEKTCSKGLLIVVSLII